ncbi:hypothetical protein [Achromobacter ruhlandii]|uniref:hypothetical protein n=1 Tax=Achromobacter ruhlandii TaxID=72557 RepID=UPI003D22CA88
MDAGAEGAGAVGRGGGREQVGMGPGGRVVCAISFGYADTAHPANSYRTSRADLDAAVRWID